MALVGPSGSGKTTLLKSINRLVEPDAGTVRLDGRDVRDVPVAALRHGIGYVIQSIGLFPHMNVAENIGIVPQADRRRERGPGRRAARAGRAAGRLGRRAIRARCRAARRSGSASPGRWRRGRS